MACRWRAKIFNAPSKRSEGLVLHDHGFLISTAVCTRSSPARFIVICPFLGLPGFSLLSPMAGVRFLTVNKLGETHRLQHDLTTALG